MHGLINRAIQCFLRDTYGAGLWSAIAAEAGVAEGGFEAMLCYEDALTGRVLSVAAARLGLSEPMILEDLGTYLVSDPGLEPLRRLLRFGGANFLDFLFSLDDLPDRARLAVPELEMPALELVEQGRDGFLLHCHGPWPGAFWVTQGALRALADDYGTLVLLEVEAETETGGTLRIRLLEMHHGAGRSFSLRSPAE